MTTLLLKLPLLALEVRVAEELIAQSLGVNRQECRGLYALRSVDFVDEGFHPLARADDES